MNKLQKTFCFLAVCLVGPRTDHSIAQQSVIDRVVAVVGKEAILLSDLNAQVEMYAYNSRIDPGTPGLKEQVLDALINEKLIYSKAQEDTTLSVSDEEVTSELDALIAQRVQQAGSEKRFEELYGMSANRMKREYRDEMRKQILASKMVESKKNNISISRREVEEFNASYKDSLPRVPEELELYHLLKVPKAGQEMKSQVKVKAQSILDSIKAGGDFADFARRYSEDKGSAPGGGDLGSVRRGQFVKEFEEAVFSLKENEISEVVETSFGFHIIQLLERRGEVVHPRHILFKVGRDTSTIRAAISLLKTFKDSVAAGMRFPDLARRHSDDKESGPLGGLLGRLPIDQLDKSVVDLVKDMIEGEISDPAEVTYGATTAYHIVYLKKRIPAHAMNLDDDWHRVEQLATTYKRNMEYQRWIKQLRTEIYWESRL